MTKGARERRRSGQVNCEKKETRKMRNSEKRTIKEIRRRKDSIDEKNEKKKDK